MSGEFLIILAQLSWAIGLLFMKKAVLNISPFLVAALAILVGAIILSPFIIHFSKELKSLSLNKIILIILTGIFWIALGEILIMKGAVTVPASIVALLTLSLPIFVAVLAIIFLGEILTWKFIVASVFMIIGYIILVT